MVAKLDASRFGADAFTHVGVPRQSARCIVPPDRLFGVLEFLKDQCGFDMLVDLTAVDYLHYPEREGSLRRRLLSCWTRRPAQRLMVKTFVNEPEPTLPSAFPLWKGADWLEREVYDMYGIASTAIPTCAAS